LKRALSDESRVERALEPLFAGIDGVERSRLMQSLHVSFSEVARGAVLLRQGDPYDSLHVLVAGSCHAEMVDSRGKVLRIETFTPPYLLAPAVLFASDNRMPGSVHAATACSIVKVRREEIVSLCSRSERVVGNLLTIMSDRFMFLSKRLSFLAFRTIRDKVEYYLDELAKNCVGRDRIVSLDMPFERLAEYFGVTRPALSRVFTELEESGRIERQGRTIRLLDRMRSPRCSRNGAGNSCLRRP
jgi:CRP/FNR family transcriptional regulator, dissimilatory nitrate respiration regulator